MSKVKISPANEDMVLTDFLVATKKQRPYFEAWIRASKRTGESIDDFLRRTLIVAALRFVAENESNNIKATGQLELDKLQNEINGIELDILN